MYRNDMYDYLKEHAYISKNKKSNYQFELSEERAECIANKFNSLVIDLYQNQWLGRIQDLEQENQELKKQLSNSHQIEVQQKEFIEYLEDKLNMCDGFLDTIKSDLEEISYAGRVSGKTYIATQIMKNETAMKCYEEVLSKYKEIMRCKE